MRKTKRNATVAGASLLVALAVLASVGSALAAEPPILPDSFYGSLTVNEESAPVGVTIVAKIAGVERGRYTTQQVGAYGYEGAGNPKLIVEGVADDKGKEIHFYIENYDGTLILASDDPTRTFESGADPREVDLVFEGVQLEAAPASVTTESATNVTVNSATLNASIDYGDYAEVDIRFQYRQEGETSWTNTSWETGYTESSYPYNLTGLSSDTTYEFRAHIAYGDNEHYGDIKTFTTLKAEPTVSTKGATNVTMNSATLNMSYDFKDYGSGDVRFGWREAGGSWNSTTWAGKSGSGSYSEGISGLSSGTNYEFYAQVKFDTQTKDGATLTFTTATPVNQPPTAAFTYSPTEPNPDETVSFDASASSDPDGTIVSYDWSFGDDTTGTGKTTTHSYSTTGDYTVTLTVEDDDGAIHSTSKIVTVVSPPVNQPPIADADGPYSVDEGETVELDGTGSSDPDGDTLTYSWAITDDPTGQASLTDADTSTPTFHAPSVDSDTNVTVKLIVDDGHGHTDSDTATVTVKAIAPPPVEFPWPTVVAVIIIVIVIVAIWYWKREEISRRLRKVLKKE